MVGLFAPEALAPSTHRRHSSEREFFRDQDLLRIVPGQILIVDPAGTEFTAVWIDE